MSTQLAELLVQLIERVLYPLPQLVEHSDQSDLEIISSDSYLPHSFPP